MNRKYRRYLLGISKGSHIRLHMILTAGILALLHKYTGQSDIIVGSPVLRQDSENRFINTVLLLRNEIRGGMSFRELLRQVRQTITEATVHQNYPLEVLVSGIQAPVAPYAGNHLFPLFDIRILMENIHHRKYIDHVQTAMMFSFLQTGESIRGKLEYIPLWYRRTSIERIIGHLYRLLSQVLSNLDSRVADVILQSEQEKKRLLYEFNGTREEYPGEHPIHRLFERQVEKTPGAVAAAESDRYITYDMLNREANRLARVLKVKGVGPDTTAALLVVNSLESVTAILGILKAGGAYLPIDPEQPEARKIFIIKDSGPRVLLVHEYLHDRNRAVLSLFAADHILDPGAAHLYPGDGSNLNIPVQAGNLSYVIYTSGTAGKPKGVMVEHRGLVNYICWAARKYTGGKPVHFPLYSSLSFDLTVTSIFTPLIGGSSIIVYRGESREFFIDRIIKENRVDIIKLTPSHLELIPHESYRTRLRRFIVGGEAFATALAGEIHRCFGGNVEIYNEYGPTETVVGCMLYRYQPGVDKSKTVPIGTPANNVQIYILDENQNPRPSGAAGELYIAGDGVARGYLNRPELTNDKFIIKNEKLKIINSGALRADINAIGEAAAHHSPLAAHHAPIYKTGDLARFIEDGNIEFLGRIDQQVKIRGYRVELAEIETKLKSFKIEPGIKTILSDEDSSAREAVQVIRCRRCLLTSPYPGLTFDSGGICSLCREYDHYKNQVTSYFKKDEDFLKLVRQAGQYKQSRYDCLLLYSGGKDSTYVLYRLVELGLKVLTFTFDNGYISQTAFENIKRTTSRLGVENITAKPRHMDKLFVESLKSNHNVCHGCWHALNSISAEMAGEQGINMVISGLSRGQIFEMRLHGLFQSGVFSEEEIRQRLLLFRKSFHSRDNRYSRILKLDLPGELLESIYFVDFFQYDAAPTREIKEYLSAKGWIQPGDTGFCSTNCIINDVGIYMHWRQAGYHFYEAPLSWDIRLGAINREEGLEEIGFKGDRQEIDKILRRIGYYNPVSVTGAVVLDREDKDGHRYLCAYFTADREIGAEDIREYLSRYLPDYMIPLYIVQMDRIPLTTNGKIDRSALPEPGNTAIPDFYTAPRYDIEEKLVEIWSEVLGIEKIKTGIGMNFFAAGGNSLSATIMAAKINKEFKVELSLAQVFKTTVIKELAAFIKGLRGNNYFSMEPVEKKEYYPLSSGQKRLYVLQQMDEQGIGYNIPSMSVLEGDVNRDKLEKTLESLVRRHESLRTSFLVIGDNPVQRLDGEGKFKIQYYEAAGAGEIIENFIRPFDLSEAPLLRVGLIRENRQRHILMVDMHHIISDGMSVGVLTRDFTTLYAGKELPRVKLHYKDYAQWQNREKEREKLRNQRNYWKKELEVEIPVLELPLDYVRPAVQGFEGSSINFEITPETANALKALTVETGTTLYMVLQAIYFIFLAKTTNREDIVIGTPVAGRRNADLEKIIGMFVNTLALRNFPTGDKIFKNFLAEVKEKTLKALENQDYPYEDLVKQVVVNRDVSRNPLFDTLFTWQNFNSGEIEIPALKLSPYHHDHKTAKFDLTLSGFEAENKLLFTFEYSTKLFRAETITRFIAYFRNIVSRVVENKDRRISETEITTEGEKRRILFDFNETGTGYPKDKTIQRLFEEQVERTPDNIAVQGGMISWTQGDRAAPAVTTAGGHAVQPVRQVSLTYGELNEGSGRLAGLLMEKGVQPDIVVGIMVERSIEMVIGIIGILKSGGAYMPIDPGYPPERIEYMLKDSGAKLSVSGGNLSKEGEKVKSPSTSVAGTTGFLSRETQPIEILYLNSLSAPALPIADFPDLRTAQPPRFPFLPAPTLAYIIYTSGSTGKPKGVGVDHTSAVNLLSALQKEYPFGTASTYLLKTSNLFDVSVTELFGWYMGGGKAILLEKNGEKDPPLILDWIEKYFVTHINFVPSMFDTFIEQLSVENITRLSNLEYIFLAGEALLPGVVKKFRGFDTAVRLENIYGPTESTVYASRCSLSAWRGEGIIPIGKPLPNIKLYIFDRYDRLQPMGIVGELCITGAGLARGYINRPGLTAEKFIFSRSYRSNRSYISERIYKTGDLARWLPEGNIEFLGRIDFQVKIRGYRIELGEIENRLLTHPEVKQALVLVKEEDHRDKRLYGYITAGKKLEVSELHKHLAGNLPGYMIPSHFVQVDKIPLTPNGKVDRKALDLYGKGLEIGGSYQPPQNDTQEKIIAIWKQVLKLDKIGIHDNYFEVGGTSFDVIRINKRMKEVFQIEIPIAVMFRYTTVYWLEKFLNNNNRERPDRTEKLEKGKVGRAQQSQKRKEARRK